MQIPTHRPLLHPLLNPAREKAQPSGPRLHFGVSYPNKDKDSFQKKDAKYVELTAPNPTPFDNTPLDGAEVIVFDLETTGIAPKADPSKPGELQDDIIEISAIKYKNGVEQSKFYRLVKPMKRIPDVVVALTGHTNEKVQAEGVDQAGALKDLADFVGPSAVFVGHNARRFDTKFIRAVCDRLGLDGIKDRFNYDHVADTLQMAQKFFYQKNTPKPANMKLNSVAEFFGYSNPGAHQAENDVVTAAKIYYRIIEELRNQGVPMNTFGDLFNYQFKNRKVPLNNPDA